MVKGLPKGRAGCPNRCPLSLPGTNGYISQGAGTRTRKKGCLQYQGSHERNWGQPATSSLFQTPPRTEINEVYIQLRYLTCNFKKVGPISYLVQCHSAGMILPHWCIIHSYLRKSGKYLVHLLEI